MKLLVTGGCGFIGSHFIEYILKTYPSASVVNLDALTYAAHPDTPAYLSKLAPSRYVFVKGNIASPVVGTLIKEHQITAVVNFAAESHVDRSILDPDSFVATNVVGAQNIANWTRQLGNIRFVHVSTDEVYGSLSPTDPPFTEKSSLDPNSPYAASKASADLMLLANQRTYNQPILITRCTNNYGPLQFPEKLLPLLIANALEDQPVPVYGDGQQVRDWIYVEDHCRGIDAVLQKGIPGEVYNISATQESKNLDLVRKVLKMLGKPESLIKFVGDRPAHDRRYGLSADRIRKELGWKPVYTFEEGLKKTVDWYVANQAWSKKVRDKKFYNYYQQNYDSKFETSRKGAV